MISNSPKGSMPWWRRRRAASASSSSFVVTAPPSPVVTILRGWNERQPIRPSPPQGRPFERAPSAPAASSTSATPSGTTASSPSQSSGRPNRCTARTARVRRQTAREVCARSRFIVCGSTSTSRGIAPHSATTFAVAGNVYAGTSTSSPGPMSSASSATCSAAVPDDTATACHVSHTRASSRSNASTRGPIVSIPSSSTAATASASAAPTSGHASLIGSSGFLGTAHDVVADHEHVHLRLQKGLDRLLRRHHDRLVLVEGRVEHDRHARQAVELGDQAVVARRDTLLDRLQPAGVVDVVDGGNLAALLCARLVDEDHERRAVVLLVPLARLIGEYRRRERTKPLAVLDPRVEDVLHVGPARVGDDRAVAERARSELHPPLEPADDVAGRDSLGDGAEERVVVEPLRLEASVAQRPLALLVAVLGAGVRVLHHEPARPAEHLVPDVVRGTDRDPAVARRRLDVEPVERRLRADAAVRDGVQRDAAGEAEVR